MKQALFEIGIIILIISIIVGICIFFTYSFIGGIEEDTCKEIYFPNEDMYNDCVLRFKCERNCNFEFDNLLCNNECKEFYKIDKTER